MDTWTVKRMVAWMQADFERRGVDSARLDADLLVAHALGVQRIALFLDPERPLIEAELTLIRALVARRRAREPIAYILGTREFYGRAFRVGPAVLIPRPDTETLVDEAKRLIARGPDGPLLDLCTGSGAVGVTLAAELPERSVVLTDLSPAALAVAADNATQCGVEARITLKEGDLFDALEPDARFACITINPPYIGTAELADLQPDVRDHEPRLALDAGDDALAFYRRIAAHAPRHLIAGGRLLVEVGIGQAKEVARLFEDAGLSELEVARDLAGIERVVSARYAG